MTELSGWERPQYQDTGQRPLIFLVAFGADPHAHPLSRSKYQCAGLPEGTDLQGFTTAGQPGYLEGLRSGYLWEDLRARDPALAAAVGACDSCAVLTGEVTAPGSMSYLRDMIGAGEWLFDCGAVAIFDPQCFTWWTRELWHAELFVQGRAQPHKHVPIFVSETAGGNWLHTRGLRLFGRPDISVTDVPASSVEVATLMINRLVAYQALGGAIAEGMEFRMAGLPDGMPCRHGGHLDDPDFNNVHVEMRWPG